MHGISKPKHALKETLEPSAVRLTLWILAALAICLALGLHNGPPEVRVVDQRQSIARSKDYSVL